MKFIRLIIILTWSFQSIVKAQTNTDDSKIAVTFLQLNDVYEISPLENGTMGGMARVSTIRKKLQSENPNTYAVLSGDFLYPSAMGSISYEGSAIKGKQMVEAMNTAGIDLVTFGNHEFDLKESELTDRINTSQFDWVSANVWHKTSTGNVAFTKIENHSDIPIPQTRVLVFKDADGTEVRIGIFGICINTTTQPYVSYEDYNTAAKRAILTLHGQCDFIVAVTHLSIADDRKLATLFPEIKLIMGGHEHVHSYDTVGTTLIAKADANAITAYVHQLSYDKDSKKLMITSHLVHLDNTVSEDPITKGVVDKWTAIADKSLRDQGFDPDEVLATLSEPYDGREENIRFRSTNLTRMIAKAFSAAVKGSDCTIYNSGGIRIDDELIGTITQYDVIRTLPYGGRIMVADMKGSLLREALDTAIKHPGNGCFLQSDRIEKDKKGNWLVNGKKLDDKKVYHVAANEYLVTGQQQYLEFLKNTNPDMVKITPPEANDKLRNDLRQAVINYLRNGGR